MLRTALRGLLLVLPAAIAQAQEDEVELPPALTYRYGIHTRNADGGVRLQINGRAMYDVGSFDDSLDPAVLSGQEWRRVRLLVRGAVGRHLGFRAHWDFSDSKGQLLDLYGDWRTFRSGRFDSGTSANRWASSPRPAPPTSPSSNARAPPTRSPSVATAAFN